MKIRSFAAALAAVALCAAPVVAQVTLPTVSNINPTDVQPIVPNAFPSAQGVFATMLQQRSFTLTQNSQHLTAPTLTTSGSTCGGSTATVLGTDASGQITEGSSNSTSCVVTFAKAFTTAPLCFVSENNVADTSLKCATSTTALTITKSSSNGTLINYLIVGLPGG